MPTRVGSVGLARVSRGALLTLTVALTLTQIFCVHAGLSPDLNSPEQDRARVRDRVRDRVARPQLARAG